MIWHSSDKYSVINFFGVDPQKGLAPQKAESFLHDIDDYNDKQSKFKYILSLFLKQINNYLFFFLAAAAVLSIVISSAVGHIEILPAILIILSMLFLAAFGAYQDYITNKTLDELKNRGIFAVNVRRDGEIVSIMSDRVVPGDILLISKGDYIPADARLIETNDLRIDEFALTGETVDVEKNADVITDDIAEINQRCNMVFAGCTVMHGNAVAVVTDVGAETEASRAAHNAAIAQNDTDNTPMSADIKTICKFGAIATLIVCTAVFLLHTAFGGAQFQGNFAGLVVDAFLDSTALAVSVLPESVPALITAVLAIGIRNLRKKGIDIHGTEIIKSTAEITTICCDKTGVLTADNMTVTKLFDTKGLIELNDNTPTESGMMLLKLAALGKTNTDDSTDSAIVRACLKYTGIDFSDSDNIYPVLAEIPFDPERRLYTSVNMVNGKPFAIVKGAPEEIINRCPELDIENALNVNNLMAEDALRVIAVAYKELDEIPAIPDAEELENDLIFSGFIGIMDDLSYNAVRTIRNLEENSIKTIMITGDNLSTATAVARRIGILHDGMKVLTGEQLDKISDEELDREITSCAVFARITPEHKFRIVKALRHNNETVAITGVNVEDAPALRKANVGMALSQSAADAADAAADITIYDTNINTISSTIADCKNIFLNIKRSIHYIVGCNLGELLSIFATIVIFGVPPLAAAHHLIINLITDTLPVLSIGMSQSDNKKNTNRNIKLLSPENILKTVICSIIICIFAIITFSIGIKSGLNTARTMLFVALIAMQLIYIGFSYTDGSVFTSNILKNRRLLISVGISALATLLIILTPLNALFGLSHLTAQHRAWLLFISVAFFICQELLKLGFIIYKKHCA